MKLRSHLAVVVLVAVIPVVIFSAVAAFVFARDQRAVHERAVKDLARVISQALDRETAASLTVLEILATSRELDTADVPAFRQEAERALALHRSWQTLVLADASGREIVNLAHPDQVALANVGDQPYFRAVAGTGRPAVTGLRRDAATQAYSLPVAVPVTRVGQVRYVLTAMLDISAIDRLLVDLRLPAGWRATILDGDGLIVARVPDRDAHRGQRATPSLVAMSRGPEGTLFSRLTREGVAVYAASSPAPRSGLTAAVDIQTALVEGPIRRTVAITLGIGILAAGAGAALALILGQRLARPIRRLSMAARTLGSGHEPPALPSTLGVAELEEVRRELLAASGRLGQSEQEREAMTAALRASEARYRGIFENTPLIVSLWAPDGTVLDVNRRVEPILGWTPEELIGRRWVDITLPASQRHGAAPIVDRILGTPAGQAAVSRYVAKDGREVMCEWYNSPLYDDEGRLTALISLGHDVTERFRGAEALQRSEAVLRQVIDVIPHLIYAKDRHGRLIFANHRFAELSGRRPEDLVGRALTDVVSVEAEAQAFFDEDREVLVTGRPKVIPEHVRTDHQGVEHILHTIKVPFHPVGSADTAVLGVSLEVTDLRRAEQQLRLLSRAIEQNPVGLMITDRAGDIVYVNPTFTAMTGYTAGEATGRNPRLLKSGEHDAAFYRELWTTITAGRDWRGELRNRRKSGDLYWEEARISPVTDSAGRITHFVALKQDVTGRRQLEDQLRQAQRLEALGLLAGGVAHDFNNLLTVIGGYAQLALDDPRVDEHLKANIEHVLGAARRASGLTRQLLAFSRQLPAQPRVLDVNVTLEEMQKMLRRLIGEDVALRLELEENLGRVRMDPGHVEQVVMNLVVNARDAMPQGGMVTVATANTTLSGGGMSGLPEVPAGPYVRVSVRDTGIGMDAATRARIFEPFFTTKEVGKGTGLGLSTVYGIVKQAGGDILVESAPGQGARFDIFLPRVAEAAGVAGPTPDLPVPGGRETVVLVEDDDDVRALMGEVLRRCGYAVLETRHPGEALLLIERHPEAIHLMVTDVVMPQMRGWELATRARALRPELRVIYVSGYADDLAQHDVERGNFLAKPVSPTTLALKVREILDRPGAPP